MIVAQLRENSDWPHRTLTRASGTTRKATGTRAARMIQS